MTEPEFLTWLRTQASCYATEAAAARAWNVTPQHLHDVLNGHRRVTAHIAAEFGAKLVPTFEVDENSLKIS